VLRVVTVDSCYIIIMYILLLNDILILICFSFFVYQIVLYGNSKIQLYGHTYYFQYYIKVLCFNPVTADNELNFVQKSKGHKF